MTIPPTDAIEACIFHSVRGISDQPSFATQHRASEQLDALKAEIERLQTALAESNSYRILQGHERDTREQIIEMVAKREVMKGKDLSGANLADANLTDAYLTGAYLFDANLFGGNLADANLFGANLTDAITGQEMK